MNNLYTCQNCGEEKEEKHFTTDLDSDQDLEEMTCEQCYDSFNED